MSATVNRILNFSAGPGILPLEVLEQAQRDFVALPGIGMSVAEISHRSKTFEAIIGECEADIRSLANVPSHYHVLFLQGGASTQFAQVPMNLLAAGTTADYIVTGAWGEKAAKEAKKFGAVNVAANTSAGNFSDLPDIGALALTPGASYVHYTSNETIQGVEFKSDLTFGDTTVVCDTSSNMFSKPIDVSKYGLVYAGAQKNLGPSGVTLVIAREDLIGKAPAATPTMMNYATHANEKSLYNTPPCVAIYLVGLVMKWLKANGGLIAMGARNERKAAKLYAEIDRTGYYKGHAAKTCRSNMNVTFRLPSEELESKFTKEATAAGLDGLKGHRSVGGIRASIYNAFPEAGVDTLVALMQEFEKKNG